MNGAQERLYELGDVDRIGGHDQVKEGTKGIRSGRLVGEGRRRYRLRVDPGPVHRFHHPVKLPNAYSSGHEVDVIADVLIEDGVNHVGEVGRYDIPPK